MTSGSALWGRLRGVAGRLRGVPGGAGESRQEGRCRQDEQGHAGYAPGDPARARTVIFVRHGRVGPRVEEVLEVWRLGSRFGHCRPHTTACATWLSRDLDSLTGVRQVDDLAAAAGDHFHQQASDRRIS